MPVRLTGMLTRRDSLRLLGAAGLAAPVLTACGERHTAPPSETGAGLRLVSADVARSAGDLSAVPGVVSAIGAFTVDLWRRLGTTAGNLALSPYSIATALAMTANGAAGTTRTQMLDVLHIRSLASYNAGIDALTQELDALAGPVTMPDGSTDVIALASADQLFGDRATSWETPFLAVLAKEYGAGMRTVDFRGAPEAARVLINRWTASRTRGRIPTILPPGTVDALTRLVLVNALYLKAPWATPFDKDLTTSQPFRRDDGTTVDVEMMHGGGEGGALYLRGDHYEGARLPYAGGTLALTVALPDSGREVDTLVGLIGGGLRAPGSDGLSLAMPRWSFRAATDLESLLKALGMALAFTDGADFSGMSAQDRLAITDVLHQAFVAVDEDGTEAAAATAVVMGETSAQVTRHHLVLDRPFLFVLHDTAHGTPLFVGRVADPS